MTAWVAPKSWSTGAVLTASDMNAEVKDHLVWLKNALDLITRGSDSDTGTGTFLAIVRPSTGNAYLAGQVFGDTEDRFRILGSGNLQWGTGAAAPDTTFGRSDTGVLKLSASAPRLQIQGLSADTYASISFLDSTGASRFAVDYATGLTDDVRFLMFTGAAGSEVSAEVMRFPSAGTFGRTPTPPPLTFYRNNDAALPAIQIGSAGAAQERWGVYGDGSMKWGGGVGANLSEIYRSPALAYTLVMAPLILWPSGIVLPTNAGAVTDANTFSGLGVQSGLIALDTTNSRLYVRVGSTWKSVVLA